MDRTLSKLRRRDVAVIGALAGAALSFSVALAWGGRWIEAVPSAFLACAAAYVFTVRIKQSGDKSGSHRTEVADDHAGTAEEWLTDRGVAKVLAVMEPDRFPDAVLSGVVKKGLIADVAASDLDRNPRIRGLMITLMACASDLPTVDSPSWRNRAAVEKMLKTLRDPSLSDVQAEKQVLSLLSEDDVAAARRCIEDLGRKHGTAATVAIAALVKARGDYLVATAMFRWLKEMDRGLWYALDNVGRGRIFVEGLAATALYDLEVREGRPLPDHAPAHAVEHLLQIAERMHEKKHKLEKAA